MKLHRVIYRYGIETTGGLITYLEKSEIKYGNYEKSNYIVHNWDNFVEFIEENYGQCESSDDGSLFVWVDHMTDFNIEKRKIYKDKFIVARFSTYVEYIDTNEITMHELNKEISVADYMKLVGDSV